MISKSGYAYGMDKLELCTSFVFTILVFYSLFVGYKLLKANYGRTQKFMITCLKVDFFNKLEKLSHMLYHSKE